MLPNAEPRPFTRAHTSRAGQREALSQAARWETCSGRPATSAARDESSSNAAMAASMPLLSYVTPARRAPTPSRHEAYRRLVAVPTQHDNTVFRTCNDKTPGHRLGTPAREQLADRAAGRHTRASWSGRHKDSQLGARGHLDTAPSERKRSEASLCSRWKPWPSRTPLAAGSPIGTHI